MSMLASIVTASLLGSGLLAGDAALTLVRSTISAGGGASSGATYTVTGTTGQWEAAPATTSGAATLSGGFWPVAAGIDCPADFTGDGIVDGADLGILLGGWGLSSGDLNDDGTTDGADLGLLLGVWGPCA